MQTTSATWKQLWAAGAPLEARAVIAGTEVPLAAAPVINRAAMQDRLSVGNVASASLALAVRPTGTIPRSAAVAVEARLNDGATASEWLPMGTFYISRRSRDPVTGVTALECYDALLKANAVWTPSTGAWPRTMAAVLAELLTLLGLTLDSRTVVPSGASFVISQPAEGTTIRDVLGTIAQAGGGNWIVTPEGKLRLVPIVDSAGAGEATEDVLDVAGVVGSFNVGTADTITGVRCTADGSVTLIGDDTGIVVDVSLTPMIAADMADVLIGQLYQAYTLTGAVCDPAAELGDYVRAGANGEVASVLYGARIVLGRACRGDIAAPEPGEVTDEYPYIGGSARTLALAKAYVNQAVDALDGELTQQEIFNRLTGNGAAQGLVLYNGQLYVNASYIKAGTLTLGGANNVNGMMQVLDASGNVIGTWNKDGVNISKGSLLLMFDSNGSTVSLGSAAGMPLYATYYVDNKTYVTYISGNNFVLTDNDSEAVLSNIGLILSRETQDGSNPFVQCIDRVRGVSASINAGQIFTADSQNYTTILPSGITTPSLSLDNPLSVGNGGTGATTASGARANIGALAYLGNLTGLGSGTPAAATKTYWESNDNVPTNSVNAAYNTNGAEYTLLFSKGGSNSYGSILKYGYNDLYLRILRHDNNGWKDSDWAKISAGYADSAAQSNCIKHVARAQNDCVPDIADSCQSFRCTSSDTGYGDGYILAWRWFDGSYVSQLYADVDANYALFYRYRTAWGEWDEWKQIPVGTVTVGQGGTGATTAAGARANLEIPDVTTWTFNGTTDANGNIRLNALPSASYTVIAAYTTSSSVYIFHPFVYSNAWNLHMTDASSMGKVANTTISITVKYINK